MKTYLAILIPHALDASFLSGQFIRSIELTPTDVRSQTPNGSANSQTFSDFPTEVPQPYLGVDFGPAVKSVNFNTAPDGELTEDGTVSGQYQSLGVTFNSIRLSEDIPGGNSYGAGFATEDSKAHVITFASPVVAAGFVSTSPGGDLIEFFSGPDATGDLLRAFNDRGGSADLFLGGLAFEGGTFRSIRITPNGSQLEIDELVFVNASAALEPLILPLEFTPEDLSSFFRVLMRPVISS